MTIASRAAVGVCAVAVLTFLGTPSARAYEGYGAVSVGGAGGDVYHVTTLADSGAGSLRNGILNRSGPRTIVFDVAGTITMQSTIAIKIPYLTIDGSTAPSPGITIKQSSSLPQFIIAGTHDIIITHLRFQGLYGSGAQPQNNAGIIGIDGDSGPDRVSQRIVLDHLTIRNSVDAGPDIWGEARDVSLSWCLIMYSWHPTTISHYPSPYQTRQRISLHHNVYAKNNDRNPQVRADVRDFDMVNNIIYGWGHFDGDGQGTRIRNDKGEPKVNANIINNYWVPTRNPSWALIYGLNPGADSTEGRSGGGTPAQGTVLTNTAMGKLYVAGNHLPPENQDHYSTIASPLPVPASAQVTTWPADQLKFRVLPAVGMMYRLADEQAIIDELSAKMVGSAPAALKADFDGNGVVDEQDLTHLMSCITSAGIPQTNPACAGVDQDGDGDVDQSDFGLLQACLSDAGEVPDARCYK